jgi:hypothetical protein
MLGLLLLWSCCAFYANRWKSLGKCQGVPDQIDRYDDATDYRDIVPKPLNCGLVTSQNCCITLLDTQGSVMLGNDISSQSSGVGFCHVQQLDSKRLPLNSSSFYRRNQGCNGRFVCNKGSLEIFNMDDCQGVSLTVNLTFTEQTIELDSDVFLVKYVIFSNLVQSSTPVWHASVPRNLMAPTFTTAGDYVGTFAVVLYLVVQLALVYQVFAQKSGKLALFVSVYWLVALLLQCALYFAKYERIESFWIFCGFVVAIFNFGTFLQMCLLIRAFKKIYRIRAYAALVLMCSAFALHVSFAGSLYLEYGYQSADPSVSDIYQRWNIWQYWMIASFCAGAVPLLGRDGRSKKLTGIYLTLVGTYLGLFGLFVAILLLLGPFLLSLGSDSGYLATYQTLILVYTLYYAYLHTISVTERTKERSTVLTEFGETKSIADSIFSIQTFTNAPFKTPNESIAETLDNESIYSQMESNFLKRGAKSKNTRMAEQMENQVQQWDVENHLDSKALMPPTEKIRANVVESLKLASKTGHLLISAEQLSQDRGDSIDSLGNNSLTDMIKDKGKSIDSLGSNSLTDMIKEADVALRDADKRKSAVSLKLSKMRNSTDSLPVTPERPRRSEKRSKATYSQ